MKIAEARVIVTCPGEEPGLGVDIDEEAAARYPYAPAYLPVNRLEDGTIHPW